MAAVEPVSKWLADANWAVGPQTGKLLKIGQLVENGIDMDRYRPATGEERSRFPRVLFIGTWEGRKRGKFVFETFIKSVLPHCPSARLTMVSDRCDCHPAVDFEGVVSEQRLVELYRNAWVFAYPSTYEGFGMCYAEAMACGLGVIASPNDGAHYVLGNVGRIVSDSSFGNAIREAITTPHWLTLQGEIGPKQASRFSLTEVARWHVQKYHQLVASVAQR